MYKVNLNLNEQDRDEILKKHLEATKKNYLNLVLDEANRPTSQGDPQTQTPTQTSLFSNCFSGYTISYNNDKMIELSSTTTNERYSFYNDNNTYNVYYDNIILKYTGTWECKDGNLYITNDRKEKYLVDKNDFFKRTLIKQTQSVNKPTFKEDNDGKYSYGSKNPMIIKLQNVLNLMGKTDFDEKTLEPDGKFGKRTLSALKKLNRYSYFKETDEITDEDINKIIENYNKKKEKTDQSTGPTPTRLGTPSDSTTGQSTSTPDTSTTGLEVTFDKL